METTTIHPAEAYLRNEQNPTSLYVRIAGKRRRLFINRNENVIGIIALGKRKSGYIFTDWASIEKIYYPSSSPEDAADIEKKLVLKYQKLARLATHTNDWLRKIANADWINPSTRTASRPAHASTASVSDLPPSRSIAAVGIWLVSERH